MSETKHTPLPWRYSEYRPRGGHLRLCIGNKDGSEQVLVARDVGWKRENLKFIVQTINARPKVEELVTAVIMADQGDLEQADRANKLAREVEAALGGKAE
ncbi:hypothetical protein LCGC14_2878740 [marine sediment metagenome]|uniref:Uncharacterized protein n=1 Tax=marine sediment metagenome TaxID=412755 RepID=A0A0F8Y0P7_9ZZZZ